MRINSTTTTTTTKIHYTKIQTLNNRFIQVKHEIHETDYYRITIRHTGIRHYEVLMSTVLLNCYREIQMQKVIGY